MNKAILIGNLGADPESRTLDSGNTITNLRVATVDYRDGERQTEWHRVTVFGKTAENVARYAHKGMLVCVEGKIQTRKWQDRDGNDKWTTEIIAFKVDFLSKKEPNGNGGYDRGDGGNNGQGYDDDIPF